MTCDTRGGKAGLGFCRLLRIQQGRCNTCSLFTLAFCQMENQSKTNRKLCMNDNGEKEIAAICIHVWCKD